LKLIAEKLRRKYKTPETLAKGLNRWVYHHIEDKKTHDHLTVEEILLNRHGDCKAHAMLYASLAKFLELPTKFCVGLVYDRNKFWGHAWNKVWIKTNWVSVDPTFNQFNVDPTHIQLGEGQEESMLLFDFVRTLTQLHSCKIEVLERT